MRRTSDRWIRCGALAIAAALGCIAVVFPPASAFAQTNYYWNGSSGTWDTTSGSWSTTAGATGSLHWVNSNQSIANFGYSGSGGGASTPAQVFVTTPIVANSLVFGVAPASNPTLPNTYQVGVGSGGSITIGNGSSPGVASCNFGANQASGTAPNVYLDGVTVAGGQDLQLSAVGLSTTATYTNVYWTIGASSACTFRNLIVTDAYPATGTGCNIAQIQQATVNGTPNVTLGAAAGIADLQPNGSILNIGSVTIAPTSTSYFPDSSFATFSNVVVRIGAGADTGFNSWPTMVVNGPISGSGNVMFCAGVSSGGVGTVVLNAQSTYTGMTDMCQYSTRNVGAAPVGLVQLGVNNALPTTTDLAFGQVPNTGGGNAGALDLHGLNQTVASLSSYDKNTSDYFSGITNFGATAGTLTICDTRDPTSVSSSFNYYQTAGSAGFAGVIGKLTLGTTAQIANSNDNIALVLAAGNTGASCSGSPIRATAPRRRQTPTTAGRSSTAAASMRPTARPSAPIPPTGRSVRPPGSGPSWSTAAAPSAAASPAARWACPPADRSPSTAAAPWPPPASTGIPPPAPSSMSLAIWTSTPAQRSTSPSIPTVPTR